MNLASDEENEKVARAMFNAALEILAPHNIDELSTTEVTGLVIKAIAAAESVERLANQESDDLIIADTVHCVASAFWFVAENLIDDSDDVVPYSVAGARYVGFAQGTAAAAFAAEARRIAADGEIYTDSGAAILIAATKEESKE